MTETDVERATTRAAAARHRLRVTVDALQTRLDPRVVARDAVDAVVDQGAKVLHLGVDAAKRNPVRAAGAVAVVAALLARRRIGALIGKLRKPKGAKPGPVPRVRSSKPRPVPVKRNST